MFYVSKIVWMIVQPSALIAVIMVVGLLIAFYRRRLGLMILSFGIALYLIAGLSPLANWLLIPLEARAEIGSTEPIDGAAGIIVLGGAMAPYSHRDQIVLSDAGDRMLVALRIAQQHPEIPVIFSGGDGGLFAKDGIIPEAEQARRFFDWFGIRAPRLKLEGRSRNTFENAVFSAELLKPTPDQRWVLVTSAFHMQRAKALFEAQGFQIIPRAGDFRTFGEKNLWRGFRTPSEGLRQLDVAAKEWVGFFVSWFCGDITMGSGLRERWFGVST